MSYKIQLLFLGTGASGGTPGNGKSKRSESSLFLQNNQHILIDVTRDFSNQSHGIKKIDAILLTHGHQDACGGINQLKTWCKAKNQEHIPLFAHPKTIATVKKTFKHLEPDLFFQEVQSDQSFNLRGLRITALKIPHSKDPRFPTFAWKLKRHKTIVYASDMAALTKEFKKFCSRADILIIDGATWKRKIYSHLRVDKDLPELCRLRVDKIILTQIGKSAPPHNEFEKQVKILCPKAIPAFDGLRIVF